jgi:hypothetical protein
MKKQYHILEELKNTGGTIQAGCCRYIALKQIEKI